MMTTTITTIGWILVVVGALVNFLAKPVLQKLSKDSKDPEQRFLYIIKTVAACVVIAGAMMIFIAGGKVDNVRTIR